MHDKQRCDLDTTVVVAAAAVENICRESESNRKMGIPRKPIADAADIQVMYTLLLRLLPLLFLFLVDQPEIYPIETAGSGPV